MAGGKMRRVIRIHVSSPEDVASERAALDEVVASINRIEGKAHGIHLEALSWGRDAIPQLGPGKRGLLRRFLSEQLDTCHIYLGILSASLGDGTTKAEFKQALANYKDAGEPWILFYFDDDARGGRSPEAAKQWVELCEFREQLEKQGIVCGYTGVRGTAASFYDKAGDHLRSLIHRLAPGPEPDEPPLKAADPSKYLGELQDNTAWIDIRGLQIGTGRVNRFPIEDLYISLTTTGSAGRECREKGKRPKPDQDLQGEMTEQRGIPLQQALRSDRLVVVGEPGAGKTTFLRRIAYALTQTRLGQAPKAAEQRLGVVDRTFPIFIRLSNLAEHLQRHGNTASAPSDETAGWLPHYLGCVSTSSSWGLDAAYFQQQLEDGFCTVLLDGLDEAPERRIRERLSRLIRNVTVAYSRCRFVITSRPVAYTGDVVLPDFAHASIDPLSDEAVETFLGRWCNAVYVESPQAAQSHCRELLGAIRGRAEIRRMARNPVMLTALAVVHWNERRLPEQRADLYQSIIMWLSRSREQRPGRETADRTVVLLQELALAMQTDSGGRKTQVPKRWAAERLAAKIGGGVVNRDTVAHAENFLDQEEVDSGIIVGRGNEVAYWHLTFQEYLAARAIASRLEGEQEEILTADPARIYLPDWREVVLLLAGALHQQGEAKVDGLIGGLLDRLGPSPSLADEARCAGLIGGILRDLQPVKYEASDARYDGLLDRVMAIFDPQRFQSVPMEDRIAAADALGQAGDPRIDFRHNDYWASIPAGKFLMGAQKEPDQPNFDPEAVEERESPVHEVYLSEYRIARYLVTVGQYEQFVLADGYKDQRWWTAGGFGEFSEPRDWDKQLSYPSRPVVGVSWWEAAAFCAWAGYRLPTEAQWERAARGTTGRKYPWGEEPADPSRTNFSPEFNPVVGHPTPIGIFPLDATPEGILDMGGNVVEWCLDGYDDYAAESVSDPAGPAEATVRVIRGGCWYLDARLCRAAFRRRYEPQARFEYLGFRVAAVPLVQPGQEPATQ